MAGRPRAAPFLPTGSILADDVDLDFLFLGHIFPWRNLDAQKSILEDGRDLLAVELVFRGIVALLFDILQFQSLFKVLQSLRFFSPFGNAGRKVEIGTTKLEIEVLLYEFKYGLDSYLSSLGPRSRVHSLEEVIKFNEKNKERVMPFFGQEWMIAAHEKGSLSSKEYRQALSRIRRLTRREGIDAIIKRRRLDAIVVVSGGPAWLIDLANGDPRSWDMESTSPAAVAGYPHITVPGGHLFNLPVGISFFSKAWSEPTLLRIAYSFEQALLVRKPPKFLSTADLKVA